VQNPTNLTITSEQHTVSHDLEGGAMTEGVRGPSLTVSHIRAAAQTLHPQHRDPLVEALDALGLTSVPGGLLSPFAWVTGFTFSDGAMKWVLTREPDGSWRSERVLGPRKRLAPHDVADAYHMIYSEVAAARTYLKKAAHQATRHRRPARRSTRLTEVTARKTLGELFEAEILSPMYHVEERGGMLAIFCERPTSDGTWLRSEPLGPAGKFLTGEFSPHNIAKQVLAFWYQTSVPTVTRAIQQARRVFATG
jgi:hypothetical protein